MLVLKLTLLAAWKMSFDVRQKTLQPLKVHDM